MPRAKELKVRVPDRPGALGEITAALAEKKVNLRAVNAWVEGAEGIVRMVVDKVPVAKKALAAGAGRSRSTRSSRSARQARHARREATALRRAGVNITRVIRARRRPERATV
jgi:hypothetical protein